MPQAPKTNARQESKEVQKAIDKEQKRNRGVMSCAECRRYVFIVYRRVDVFYRTDVTLQTKTKV